VVGGVAVGTGSQGAQDRCLSDEIGEVALGTGCQGAQDRCLADEEGEVAVETGCQGAQDQCLADEEGVVKKRRDVAVDDQNFQSQILEREETLSEVEGLVRTNQSDWFC
jgi:hypothetical protein